MRRCGRDRGGRWAREGSHHATYRDRPGRAPPRRRLALRTAAHGVWEGTGERSAALTAALVETDEGGRVLGTVTFHGTVQLDDGLDAYRYTGVAEVADPSGAVVSTRPSSTRATRLRVDRARAAAGAPDSDGDGAQRDSGG